MRTEDGHTGQHHRKVLKEDQGPSQPLQPPGLEGVGPWGGGVHPHQHHHFGILASRMKREYMSVILNLFVSGPELQQPQETQLTQSKAQLLVLLDPTWKPLAAPRVSSQASLL